MKRVVVTGMDAITSIGQDWNTFHQSLKSNKSGIVKMVDWDRYADLRTRLAGPIPDFEIPKHYPRKKRRTMGRVALLATRASERALEDAGLIDDPILKSGQTGISYGSSSGSPDAIGEFGNMIINHKVEGLNASSYIRMMPHTSPVNLGVFFGIQGRVITTSSACTSGSQGIGYAYEAIKYGMQTVMVAGGCEELDAIQAAVFDTMFATSTNNDHPKKSQ